MALISDTIREIHRLNVRIERIDLDLMVLDCTPIRLNDIQREREEQTNRRERLLSHMQGGTVSNA